MKIKNTTKSFLLAQEAVLAHRLWQRIKGLLGRKELPPGQGLILKPCNSIHTYFMRFPIDVLFVDRSNRVIKALADLKPNRLTPLYFNAHIVIELPIGLIKASRTEEGDIIKLEE